MSTSFKNTSKRLGDLLLYGWTMLGDPCSICNCPLSRSPDGKKYCAGCESWISPNKKPEFQKFEEIISIRNQPNKEQSKTINKKEENKNEIKNTKEEKKINKIEEREEKIIQINKDNSTLELIENKLKKLSIELNEENDIKKCENIIQLMNKLLDFIERYKIIQK